MTAAAAADQLQQDMQSLSENHSVETIFVWDFDWTIINCNSDEYVPAGFLGDEEVVKRITAEMKEHGPTKWHECVANLINACMLEKASSNDDILEKAAEMPYLVDVKQALTDVANNKHCRQAIISDGNDKFIDAYLRKNEMKDYFSAVETNVGSWENNNAETSFKIRYQSSKYGGHECKLRCPPNLCKTQVLKDILNRMKKGNGKDAKRPRIVYVGDGHNDACPALQVLNENDVLLAREGKRCPNPNSVSGPQFDKNHDNATSGTFAILSTLEKAERREGCVPKCRVCPWNTGKELLSLVHGILS
mmetsp:Transcript_18408/g.31154  ORF Transcript_18408/g.31154 Transcript_18408/m.31154 type:complete len:305 (-) Transcript_18408:980-1894(-)